MHAKRIANQKRGDRRGNSHNELASCALPANIDRLIQVRTIATFSVVTALVNEAMGGRLLLR